MSVVELGLALFIPSGWLQFEIPFVHTLYYVLATLDPIRCTLCVKPGGSRVLTSGQNQLFPSRGYIAETYAKVMGGSPPITAPHQAKVYPLCLLMDRGGWVGFTPYCVHRKPAAARRGRVCSRTLGVTATPSPTDDARGEA